jgi:hypothetical protein
MMSPAKATATLPGGDSFRVGVAGSAPDAAVATTMNAVKERDTERTDNVTILIRSL